MEEKLLKIAVTMSVENILKEMRKFSPEPLTCVIVIDTRANPEEEDAEKQYDQYKVGIANAEGESFVEEHKKVFWHFDPREGEGIRKTEPLSEEREDE